MPRNPRAINHCKCEYKLRIGSGLVLLQVGVRRRPSTPTVFATLCVLGPTRNPHWRKGQRRASPQHKSQNPHRLNSRRAQTMATGHEELHVFALFVVILALGTKNPRTSGSPPRVACSGSTAAAMKQRMTRRRNRAMPFLCNLGFRV